MRSTIGIDVAAPPDLVFALASDVRRWSTLLPHYVVSRELEARMDGSLVCDFVARRPLVPLLGLGIPVAWRSRTWSEVRSRRLRFVHVAGATRGMDVTWSIEPSGRGTRIEIEHRFRRRLPASLGGMFLGDELFPAVVDRLFTRPIAGRTLATFKALAESVAALADASDSASATNLRS